MEATKNVSKLLGLLGFGFGVTEKPDMSSFDSAPAASKSADSSKSLLSRVDPNTSTKVSSTALSSHSMQANKAHSAGEVKQNIAAVSSVKQSAQAMQGQIMDTVCEMQRDLMAATKEAGYQHADVFPDKRDAAGGEFGLCFSLAMDAVSTGKAALQSVSDASKIGDIVACAKKGRIDITKAKAEIQEVLVSMSSASCQKDAGLSGGNNGNNAAPLPKTRFNFASVTRNDIDTIAYANKENMAANFPEFAAARDIEQRAQKVENELLGVGQKSKDVLSQYNMSAGAIFDIKGHLNMPDSFDLAVKRELFAARRTSVAEPAFKVPDSFFNKGGGGATA